MMFDYSLRHAELVSASVNVVQILKLEVVQILKPMVVQILKRVQDDFGEVRDDGLVVRDDIMGQNDMG